MRVVTKERQRETKASAKHRKSVEKSRRGMYAAATFASMATAMIGAGHASADIDFPAPPADLNGLLSGAGDVAGQVLDPGQQGALDDALGAASAASANTPFGDQVNSAIDNYRAGGAPAPGPDWFGGGGGTPGGQSAPGAVATEVAGRVPAPVADLAATVAQIAGSGMQLDQLATWANKTFPDGPMRGPVNDLLAFVEQATELAGTRRTGTTPAIDDLIDQARTLFGFPKDGPDPVKGLRDMLTPTVGQQDPVAQQLPPGLLAIAAPVIGLFAPQLAGMAPVLAFLAPLLALASNRAAAIGAVFTEIRDAVRGLVSDARHPAALPLLAIPVIAVLAIVPLLFAGGIGVAAVLALGAVVLGAILLAPLVIGALIIGGLILAVLAVPVLIVLAVIAIPVLLIAIPVAIVAFTVLAPVILVGGIAAIAVAIVGGIALAVVALAAGLALSVVGFVVLAVAALLTTVFVPVLGLVLAPLLFGGVLAFLVVSLIATAVAFFGVLGVAGLATAALIVGVGLLSLLTPFGLIAIPVVIALAVVALAAFGAVGLAGG
ncbi:hypothetical protein [Nocardia sp. NPDC060255]